MWSYLILYLTSFLTFKNSEGKLKEYIKESKIFIPYSDFKKFVYRRVWSCFGVSIFSTLQELEENLKTLENLGILKWEESIEKRIVIDKKGAELLLSKTHEFKNDFLNRNSSVRKDVIVREYYARLFLSGISDEERISLKEEKDYDTLGKIYEENLKKLEKVIFE
jgi:hypothetical protein